LNTSEMRPPSDASTAPWIYSPLPLGEGLMRKPSPQPSPKGEGAGHISAIDLSAIAAQATLEMTGVVPVEVDHTIIFLQPSY